MCVCECVRERVVGVKGGVSVGTGVSRGVCVGGGRESGMLEGGIRWGGGEITVNKHSKFPPFYVLYIYLCSINESHNCRTILEKSLAAFTKQYGKNNRKSAASICKSNLNSSRKAE